MKRGFLTVLSFLLLALFFTACRKSDDASGGRNSNLLQPGDTAVRTVLAYVVAENDLYAYATFDLREMHSAAHDIPDNCYMLAFVDAVKKPFICRFYCNGRGEAVCDTVRRFDEDFISTDTLNFRAVLDWVQTEYPSQEMGLVMWSHGSGWTPRLGTRSFGADNGVNTPYDINYQTMEVEQMASVLKGLSVPLRYILFDACFMQCVETAYALRDCAEWLVGSPAEIPANGAPYDAIMADLMAVPFDAKTLIEKYESDYPKYNGVMLSAVDCSQMDALAQATAAVVPSFFSVDSAVNDSLVFKYLPGAHFTSSYSYPDYCDMNGEMMLRLPHEAYEQWKEALDKAVPYRVASLAWVSAAKYDFIDVDFSQYSGLSMYVPRDDERYSSFNASFKDTEWYKATGWGATGW